VSTRRLKELTHRHQHESAWSVPLFWRKLPRLIRSAGYNRLWCEDDAMPELVDAFIEAASSAGWRLERRDSSRPVQLPTQLIVRLGPLPDSYRTFLSEVAVAANADGGVWFLCEDDYRRRDPEGFTWDEIEAMSILRATHEAEREAIVDFWDRHLPIMMAPDGDYDYLAIALDPERRGTVVHGYAPDWENATQVADSFEQWLSMLTQSLRDPSSAEKGPLALHVMSRYRAVGA
jgi:hypothetical protein